MANIGEVKTELASITQTLEQYTGSLALLGQQITESAGRLSSAATGSTNSDLETAVNTVSGIPTTLEPVIGSLVAAQQALAQIQANL